MKKIIGFALILILCLGMISVTGYADETDIPDSSVTDTPSENPDENTGETPDVPPVVTPAAPTAALNGPEIIRVGQTITLTFQVNGQSLYGAEGTLEYNTDQLELVEWKQVIRDTWVIDKNDATGKFLAYDNNQTDPIIGATDIFTVSFKVKELEVGTAVQVSCKNVVLSEISAGYELGDLVYSTVIGEALATDNTLASMVVSNANINPGFSSDVTKYTTWVPFSVSSLEIVATPNHEKATVTISNNELKPNVTTEVKVIVTAEDGSTRVYIIQAHRAQDPSYIPSTNNTLKDIKVTEFRLSPVFDKNVTKYLIWLPTEVDKVEITATPEDKNASVRIVGADILFAGMDNEIQVICIAENGDEKIYTVIAKRAAPHGDPGETDPTDPLPTDPTQPSQPTTDPSVTLPSSSQVRPTGGSQFTNATGNADGQSDTNVVLIILFCILGLIAAAGLVFCIMIVAATNKKGRFSSK